MPSSSSSAAPPTTTPAPKPVAWLATLQQRFLEGRGYDVVIRVSIEQPAVKRVRTDDGIATRNGANAQQQQHQQQEGLVIDILCHSVILKSRSRYFDAALGGAYVENQQRTVEIVLADEQAVEDLRLFIKLVCPRRRCAVAEGHAAASGLSC